MIKTTIGGLSSPGLNMALSKLNGAQLDSKTAYRVKKLHDAFESQMKKIRKAYTDEVVDKFAEKDEKGNLIPEQCPWGFKLKADVKQEDFDAANDEFHKREAIIDRPALTFGDLNGVKISAAEISALGDFLSDPENEEAPANVAQIRR
jgi:hypothetical protein